MIYLIWKKQKEDKFYYVYIINKNLTKTNIKNINECLLHYDYVAILDKKEYYYMEDTRYSYIYKPTFDIINTYMMKKNLI